MKTTTVVEERNPSPTDHEYLRSTVYAPPRRHWPGILAACILAACILGAAIAALAVSSFYDKRSIGERLDASVAATKSQVNDQVADLRASTSDVARDSALATDRAANVIGDAGITAAVKTALAADPSLSAVKIQVKTEEGVVSLDGPAPDVKSRDRAEVLAAAPQGVQRVENRLVIVPPESSTH